MHTHFTTALETVTAASQLGAAIQTMSLCVRPLMTAGLPVESGNGGSTAGAAGGAAASDALEAAAAAAAAAAGATPASEEQRATAAQAIASGGRPGLLAMCRLPRWLVWCAAPPQLPSLNCTLPLPCCRRPALACCHLLTSLAWNITRQAAGTHLQL